MTVKAKAKKVRKPGRYVVRFDPNPRDLQTLNFLAEKKHLTYSNTIRLALAELAERNGFVPGAGDYRQTSEHAAGVSA